MNRNQTLELWEARFKKLIQLEVEAKKGYASLLRRYSHLLAGTRIQMMIRKIMKDEAHHIDLARKLLEIVQAHKKVEHTPNR